MMESKVSWFSFILHILVYFRQINAYLNIEELNSVNYGIDILKKPILLQDLPAGSLLLTSRHGQKYQCDLPIKFQFEFNQTEEKIEAYSAIPDLLKPMEMGPCLIKTKDWWTYEFCYGKYVKQYHLEDNKKMEQIMTLGYYSSEYDWSNNTDLHEKSNRNRLQRYHSQQYMNGSVCDVTGKLRQTEVRFMCEEGAGDYIARIDEPESCIYILTVHTTKICHHPYLRPPPNNKPRPIQCSPALVAEQYNEYLYLEAKKEKEREKEIMEQKSREIAEKIKVLNEVNFSVDKGDDEIEQKTDAVSEEKEQEKPETTDNEAAQSDVISEKVSVSPNSQHSFPGTADEVEISNKILLNNQDKDSSVDDVTVSSEEDQDILEEFDRGLESIISKKEDRIRLSSRKEELRAMMKDQVDEVIEEMEDNLKNEGLTGDQAYNQLAATISKLLERLDKADRDIEMANEQLERAEKMLTKLNKHSKDQNLEITDSLAKSTPKEITSKDPDDLVKVRVSKISGNLKKPDRKSELAAIQKEKLENAVRDQLEKAGLGLGGRKIEVKIITSNFYDDDKDFHVLTEEETAQFQNMIITILGGSPDALEEMERQQTMEDNYNFVWSNPTAQSQSKDDEEES